MSVQNKWKEVPEDSMGKASEKYGDLIAIGEAMDKKHVFMMLDGEQMHILENVFDSADDARLFLAGLARAASQYLTAQGVPDKDLNRLSEIVDSFL